MQKLTDREINIAAARYAGVRMLALVLVIGLNLFAAIEFGYDVRTWEWWAISPLATLGTVLGILFLDEAIGGIRVWDPIKNYRLSRDWRLVSTLQAYVNWVDDNGNTTSKDEIFYYLFENGLGERKIKHDGAGRLGGDGGYAKQQRLTHPYYLGEVRPWLEGGYNPDIPSYESIKAKEFKDNLAGRIT